jgi:hypothetical protein
MGRKSREKRERRTEAVVSREACGFVADEGSSEAPTELAASKRPARRRKRPVQVGARVARVAVDDETWMAFRDLCGPTPASIRLGQLVAAEVRRARGETDAAGAAAAIRAIRAHADELEAWLSERAPRGGAGSAAK